MKKMHPVWIICTIGALFIGVLFAGVSIGVFMSIEALLVVVLPPVFLSFAVFPIRDIPGYFGSAYHKTQSTRENLLKAHGFFKALQSYVMYTGLAASVIGIIAMLTFLGDKTHVGRNSALALLAVFYSVVINLILVIPYRAAVEKRLAETDQ